MRGSTTREEGSNAEAQMQFQKRKMKLLKRQKRSI